MITGLVKKNTNTCFYSSNNIKKETDEFYISYAISNCKDKKLVSLQSWEFVERFCVKELHTHIHKYTLRVV